MWLTYDLKYWAVSSNEKMYEGGQVVKGLAIVKRAVNTLGYTLDLPGTIPIQSQTLPQHYKTNQAPCRHTWQQGVGKACS
jgi:hypothetical protein